MSDWALVKQDMVEILGIVKMCPEPLQEKCFELLVSGLLQDGNRSKQVRKPAQELTPDAPLDTPPATTGDDIVEADLHTKVRRFLSKEGIAIDQINVLYYKEDGEIRPLYETPGTHKMAEAQIRLALLTAFENALPNGDFCFDVETVRTRSQDMKCYDSANFAANFKNSAALFDNFTYKKGGTGELSSDGKKELATAIKLLAAE